LNPSAPLTRAVDLYSGNFYRRARGTLLNLADRKQELDVHVLIVSALYGLVKLDEGIKEYELTITDRLVNGMKVIQVLAERRSVEDPSGVHQRERYKLRLEPLTQFQISVSPGF